MQPIKFLNNCLNLFNVLNLNILNKHILYYTGLNLSLYILYFLMVYPHCIVKYNNTFIIL